MSATAQRLEDLPKRTQIMDAAAALFIAQGYGAVSMDAIAKAAAVSKATLYAYFRSKDALFATIIREACESNLAFRAFETHGANTRAALLELGGKMLRFLLEDRALAIHRVVMAESMRFPELGRAFYENGPRTFCRVFADWLEAQAQAGRLKVADLARAADQFVGMLKGSAWGRAALGVPPPPDEAEIDATVTSAVDAFLSAYGTALPG